MLSKPREMSFGSQMKPTNASISAIVTRADGTVEDLGLLTCYHRNLIMRLRCWWSRKQGKTLDH